MRKPKVGDYVESLINDIVVIKGKNYKVFEYDSEDNSVQVDTKSGDYWLYETQYKLLPKTLDNLEVGDVLVKEAFEATITVTDKSVSGKYVATCWSEQLDKEPTWDTPESLKEGGWKLKEEPKEYTLEEIAKALGIESKNLRIKE